MNELWTMETSVKPSTTFYFSHSVVRNKNSCNKHKQLKRRDLELYRIYTRIILRYTSR